jgi:hypothetical protein
MVFQIGGNFIKIVVALELGPEAARGLRVTEPEYRVINTNFGIVIEDHFSVVSIQGGGVDDERLCRYSN